MSNRIVTAGEIGGLLEKRKKNTDKRDYGSVAIFAGSEGMAGAGILAAKAALRSGAGLVHIATPEENFPLMQMAIPEAICIDRGRALGKIDSFDAVAFGPGVGTEETSNTILEILLEEIETKPLVIDADGLNLLAEDKELAASLGNKKGARPILTPHRREAERLLKSLGGTDKAAETLEEEREAVVNALAGGFNSVALLKGSGTLIKAGDSEEILINPTGNPGMATAGAGDVLTGVITALLGQGLEPVDAAKAGAFVHGLAGDLAAEEYGERSLMAGDIIKFLPKAFMKIEEGSKVFF